jgi:hypothetical protein
MKKIYGYPTVPDLKIDLKESGPAFTDFTISLGESTAWTYDSNNLFFRHESKIYYLPVHETYSSEKYNGTMHKVTAVRKGLTDILFPLLSGKQLGPTVFIPIDTLTKKIGLDHDLVNSGIDYWHGFCGKFETNGNLQESYEMWVEWYTTKQMEMSALGLSINDIPIKDQVRREALIEAKRRLELRGNL